MSSGLWLPLIWLFLLGSRFLSQWLNAFGFSFGAVTLEEGSPLDALVFLIMLIAGTMELRKRGVNLAEFVHHNRLLTFFFVYCFLAIFWSDFPFVSFKRWIKILGHPIMVLLVLTDPYPEQALTRLMKLTAYIVVPISVVFIKYFPDLGRGFDPWNGQPVNTGITLDKNALGHDCMVLGLFYFWYWLRLRKREPSVARRNEIILILFFVAMIGWLFHMAHSMTSVLSMTIGILAMIFVGIPAINKRAAPFYLALAMFAMVGAELIFGVSAHVVEFLGKDPTLTGRTELWQELLRFPINPILGTGFESFWLGERLDQLSAGHWWQPNQAHNGYLETYLNMGVIGLLLMVGLLLVTVIKTSAELVRRFELGRFRIGILAMVVFYNWTEAAFKGLSFVWFIFFLAAVDYPEPEISDAQASIEQVPASDLDEQEERVSAFS